MKTETKANREKKRDCKISSATQAGGIMHDSI
ncbi:MAG: hypothetical protein RL616_686 [Verrucomicrobiota bacterium]